MGEKIIALGFVFDDDRRCNAVTAVSAYVDIDVFAAS
jgi:hypothetical protein